jgi:hypothetical protein
MSNSVADLEKEACVPRPVESKKFNPNAILPHSLKIKHVQSAMVEWIDFLGFINGQLATRFPAAARLKACQSRFARC